MSDPEIRIMIVEDHAVVRQGLAALLGTVPGFSVVAQAGDGLQAVDLFSRHQPDITLMDLRLPQMNGVDAIVEDPRGLSPGAHHRAHHLRRR